MKNTSDMNLSEIKKGPLKDIFNALEEAFEKNDIDFYLIGAQARDQWYAKQNLVARQTNDVDFAVYISDAKDYQNVRNYLHEHFGFTTTKENQFVLFSPSGLQIDILPFGELEIEDAINFKGEGLNRIKVNGFGEIYENGTADFKMDTGNIFKVATLPAIVLLKLIAFDDRPEKRLKDAIDINNIISHFFNIQAENIYSNHNDLFLNEKFVHQNTSLPEIAAIVIGREMKKIAIQNPSLTTRLKNILEVHIEQKSKSAFVRGMITDTEENVAEKVSLLRNILVGFEM